jgi:hypothetical protein
LEQAQHEALKKLAADKSVSMAQLIREAVANYIVQAAAGEEDFDLEEYLNDPLWKIPEMAEELGPSGISDGSVNHDYYIYEVDKPYQVDRSDESTSG